MAYKIKQKSTLQSVHYQNKYSLTIDATSLYRHLHRKNFVLTCTHLRDNSTTFIWVQGENMIAQCVFPPSKKKLELIEQ